MSITKRTIIIIAFVSIIAAGIFLSTNHHLAIAQDSDKLTYVPGAKCKTCHIKMFKAHAESPHGTAFENVKDVGEEKNATCLECHSTGYGETGGFVDAESTANLAGVTCQACHGPGSAHLAAPKEQKKDTMEKPDADVCAKCHKLHGEHPELGAKELPYLKKKLEKLQNQIQELENKG